MTALKTASRQPAAAPIIRHDQRGYIVSYVVNGIECQRGAYLENCPACAAQGRRSYAAYNKWCDCNVCLSCGRHWALANVMVRGPGYCHTCQLGPAPKRKAARHA